MLFALLHCLKFLLKVAIQLVFDDRNVTSFHLPISLFEILRSLTSSILILEIIFNVQFSRYHITCFASYFEKSLRDSRYFYRNASPLSVFLNRNSFVSIPWRQRDSNSRPPACKAGALPTELSPHLIRQPPAFPYRLQYSIIGRLGLNHRVRDENGCLP